MKLMLLRLRGYLGISNGLLRDEVVIDFSRSVHKICLIKGATGSGKTTLMNAMSPLPDDNSVLVPHMVAEKELIYNNGFRILIQHPITNSGERATTKAYIWENGENLNPNGNVTSYKEIVYDKFGLDSNFEALSKMSMRDRGLADKTPGVRKKYVSSIIQSVEVYNEMHKKLTKNVSLLKSMMKSMAAKIDSIGDPNTVDTNISALESLIQDYESQKDTALFMQAGATATLHKIDPNGSIMASYTEINDRLKNCMTTLNSTRIKIEQHGFDGGVSLSTIDESLSDLQVALAKKNYDIDATKASISELTARSTSDAESMNKKVAKLNSLTNDNDYDTLISNINRVSTELAQIETFFKEIGISDGTILTTSEYKIGMDLLVEFKHDLASIFDKYSMIIPLITDRVPCETEQVMWDKHTAEQDLKQIELQIAKASGERDTYAILANRPSNCKIDTCPFIQKALQIGEDPDITIKRLTEQATHLKNTIAKLSEEYDVRINKNACLTSIFQLHEKIMRNKSILIKLPIDLSGILDLDMLIHNITSKSSFMACLPDENQLYEYLNKAYMFDAYKSLVAENDRLLVQKQIFDSKADIIGEIQSDITELKNRVDTLVAQIDASKAKLLELYHEKESYEQIVQTHSIVRDHILERDATQKAHDDCQAALKKISTDMEEINRAQADIRTATLNLNNINQLINPAKEELNKFKFNKQKLAEYNEEMAIIKNNYEKTEIVRRYTSPTDKEGIQLIFMDMYMHDILELANKLLSNLFGGQFMLQPFVITGDEFRIPCIGNRMMNDDISSMSTGQICMISMILSFSMLYNSATDYNILRLDEIDGGLDTDNRIWFIRTLNDIMNILGCEQCFLISHNEEIQYSSTDMILLKTNSDNHDYGQANIIFDINRD